MQEGNDTTLLFGSKALVLRTEERVKGRAIKPA